MANFLGKEISLLTTEELGLPANERAALLSKRHAAVLQQLNDAKTYAGIGARPWLTEPNFPDLAEAPGLLGAFQQWAEEVGLAGAVSLPSLDRAKQLGMPELVTVENYPRELGQAPSHRVLMHQLEAATNAFERTQRLLVAIPEAIDQIRRVDPEFAQRAGFLPGRESVDAKYALLALDLAALNDANNVIALAHRLGIVQGITLEEAEAGGVPQFKIEVTDIPKTSRSE